MQRFFPAPGESASPDNSAHEAGFFTYFHQFFRVFMLDAGQIPFYYACWMRRWHGNGEAETGYLLAEPAQ